MNKKRNFYRAKLVIFVLIILIVLIALITSILFLVFKPSIAESFLKFATAVLVFLVAVIALLTKIMTETAKFYEEKIESKKALYHLPDSKKIVRKRKESKGIKFIVRILKIKQERKKTVRVVVIGFVVVISFLIFIIPLILRPSKYIIYDNGINEHWFPQVLGEQSGVIWETNYLLPSGNRSFLITFNGYRELQEFVLTSTPSTRQIGVNIEKHLRLKGEKAQLRLIIKSLDKSVTVDCRVGGSNNDSIEFGRGVTKTLAPNFSQRVPLPPNLRLFNTCN